MGPLLGVDAAALRLLDVVVPDGGAPQAVVRDGLGTTHHEAGTLWMGTNPASSVTNADGRFHHVLNTYALGPALLPSIGSPNPMLSGVALARRLGDHLVAEVPAPPLEDEFEWLFDGTASSFAGWVQAGPGRMVLDEDDGVLIAEPGPDIGLCYFGRRRFADFVLRLQFRIEPRRDNSGVFVRFRDPCRPPGDVVDTRALTNPAWIAVRTGFEVQIDDSAPGVRRAIIGPAPSTTSRRPTMTRCRSSRRVHRSSRGGGTTTRSPWPATRTRSVSTTT